MRIYALLHLGIVVLVMLTLVSIQASAQADLNCDDFDSQGEAQASLNGTYPDDPNALDRDEDWIACEDFFELTPEEEARVVPADLASRAGDARPDSTPAPSPTPASPPPASSSTVAGARVDPPADLMAQVASCEVVAVSSRSIAAAGCPGVGTIVLRPPAGTPRMRSLVIIRPGASLRPNSERVVTAAQVADQDSRARKRKRDQREGPRDKRQVATQASAGKK